MRIDDYGSPGALGLRSLPRGGYDVRDAIEQILYEVEDDWRVPVTESTVI